MPEKKLKLKIGEQERVIKHKFSGVRMGRTHLTMESRLRDARIVLGGAIPPFIRFA